MGNKTNQPVTDAVAQAAAQTAAAMPPVGGNVQAQPQPEVVQQAKQEAAGLSAADLAAIIGAAVGQALAVQQQANAEQMREVIALLKPQAADEPPPPDPREVQSELEAQLAEERFLVTITKGDKYSVNPVPVGVNGILRTINRGEFAVITRSMLGVLRDSVEVHIDPETREPYDVQCYPYSVLAKVPKELWDLTAIDVANQLLPDRAQGLQNRMN